MSKATEDASRLGSPLSEELGPVVPERDHFEEWLDANRRRMHCANYSDEERMRSAYYDGRAAVDRAVAAERDRRAKERATLMAAAAMLARMVEGDSVTMAVISEMAEDIGRVLRPNVEFSGVPAGHSSNHPAGGTSAGTQG